MKKVKIDDGAGPSGSYMVMKEWAKLEAKMEMKQVGASLLLGASF